MALTAFERYSIKKRFSYLIATIILYIMYGEQLVSFAESLDVNRIAANIIVFGTLGALVHTIIDFIDKTKIKRRRKKR